MRRFSRLAGYRYDAPSSPGGAGYSDFFTNSGAASLLANWISRRAVKIEEVRMMIKNYIQRRVDKELEKRGYTEAAILSDPPRDCRECDGDAEISATGSRASVRKLARAMLRNGGD